MPKTSLPAYTAASRSVPLQLGGLLLALALALPARADAQADDALSPAQAPIDVAVMQTASTEAGFESLTAALDPLLLAELGKHETVRIAARPAIDLPALQLAIDCVSDTRECLRSAAEQAGTEGLIAASLQRVGDETLVSLLYFDVRGEATLRTAARRYAGDEIEAQVLDAVPAMVREVLGLPAEQAAAAPDPLVVPADDASAPAPDSIYDEGQSADALPVVPLVITATGVALAATGIVFGVLANGTESEYAELVIDDARDVKKAKALIDRGDSEALLSNVFLGVGAVAIVTGVVWWIADGSSHDEPASSEETLSLLPRLGPSAFGLLLQGPLPTP